MVIYSVADNKAGSHDTAGRACCVVRFLARNFAPKMHARKRKVLAKHLLFLLWPVLINGGGGGPFKLRRLRSGGGLLGT